MQIRFLDLILNVSNHCSDSLITSYLVTVSLKRSKSQKYKRRIKSAKKTPIKKDSQGRSLCRWCGVPVVPPKRTFCSKECVHEWKLRSSPQYVRQCLFKRDRGVCTSCGLDTYKLSKGLRKPLAGESKEDWSKRVKQTRKKYNIPDHRVTLWDANHKIPVASGGGCCDLDNFESLCIWCHRKITNNFLHSRRNNE